MSKGPKLNNISRNFTTRDSLGIEGVAAIMQADICPVVNTVTPRAFYWPFMTWIYYDFYRYSGIEEHNLNAFDAYLKRQDYFFVLATLLTEGSDQNNLVGKQQSQIDIDENPTGPYPFNSKYFKTTYGGMQYYNAGCLSMYFITDYDPQNDKSYSFPVLRPEGEEMAKAFEAVIKNTRYYKEYRKNDKPVPRDVLEEYGKVINFGLVGFDECKKLLRHYMFEDDRAVQLTNRSRLLTECCDYLKTIVTDYGVTEMNRKVCRQLFYDYQLPNGKDLIVAKHLVSVANKWEIVIGRMYFVTQGRYVFNNSHIILVDKVCVVCRAFKACSKVRSDFVCFLTFLFISGKGFPSSSNNNTVPGKSSIVLLLLVIYVILYTNIYYYAIKLYV